METLRLGRTAIEVSKMGFGTGPWGNKSIWGFGDGYAERDVKKAFKVSLDAGITFFDTAEVYGDGVAETILGEVLREYGEGRKLVVTTKFMPQITRHSGEDVLSALEASLYRLGLGAVDLYQIHFPLPPSPVDVWAEALKEAVDRGWTRAVGVSNFDEIEMRRMHEALAKRGIPLASNQVRYSLLFREIETNGVMAACRELGISVIAYSPIAQGLLTGKYGPENPPPLARRDRYKDVLRRLPHVVAQLRRVGAAHGGLTPAQVALNWTMAKGTIPIPGAKNAEQALENVGALGWKLTDQELASLDEACSG
ncbi:MAG: aldo/keto reductase [Bacillota bacterium]|nr:aldo/keto reductase [Bacillota bacterium]